MSGNASELTRTRLTMYYKYRESTGYVSSRPKRAIDPKAYDSERGKLLRNINALQREFRLEYGVRYRRPDENASLRELRRDYALMDWYIRKEFIKRFRQRYPASKFLFFDSESYWLWKQRLAEYIAEGKV